MAAPQQQIEMDALLATALRGEAPAWPELGDPALGLERILYHGIAGLITERAAELDGWPSDLIGPVRSQAIAQAMWEMRHKPLLAGLFASLAEANITALLLKGSALAYDLYSEPSARSRGDSDVLIASRDLDEARRVLERSGFERGSGDVDTDELALQEIWTINCDGGLQHHIDLHWQLLNAPLLAGVMEFGDCATNPLPVPRLGSSAIAMRRVSTLLHTCIHRAMHITNPYFVDGVTYFGGDRLIWAKDIDLLAATLSEADWEEFATAAVGQGVSAVALNGLEYAHRFLGTVVPIAVCEKLGAARHEPASTYLLQAGQMRRSWSDLMAIPGLRRKFAYASTRALPSPQFMRSKYPDMKDRPIAALHARRMIELVLPRPGQRKKR